MKDVQTSKYRCFRGYKAIGRRKYRHYDLAAGKPTTLVVG